MVAAIVIALALGGAQAGGRAPEPVVPAPTTAAGGPTAAPEPAPAAVAAPVPAPVPATIPATLPSTTPVASQAVPSPVTSDPSAALLLPVFDSPTGTTIVGYVGPAHAATMAGGATPGPVGDAIVVTGRARDVPGDPLQAINAKSYEVTQAVDRAIVAPAATVYKGVPSPVRAGLRHFFQNLQEPIVALNYLLQLKPGKAAETVARFAINSTIGVAGILDVAKSKTFNLPRRTNGFANTLGYYGVGPGPFFFLPLVGPTTIRDLLGGAVDTAYFGALSNVTIGKILRQPKVAIPAGVVRALDFRIEFDEHIKEVNEESPDPYVAARQFYLNRRAAEIEALHHRKPKAAVPTAVPASPPAPALSPTPASSPVSKPEPVPAH